MRIYSGFGVLGVACWPLVPKFAGSNPVEAVGCLVPPFAVRISRVLADVQAPGG